MGVSDDGDKDGGEDDGVDGSEGGGDIREFKPQNVVNTLWAYATMLDDGDKAGGADGGATGVASGGDVRGVQASGGCKDYVVYCKSRKRELKAKLMNESVR